MLYCTVLHIPIRVPKLSPTSQEDLDVLYRTEFTVKIFAKLSEVIMRNQTNKQKTRQFQVFQQYQETKYNNENSNRGGKFKEKEQMVGRDADRRSLAADNMKWKDRAT